MIKDVNNVYMNYSIKNLTDSFSKIDLNSLDLQTIDKIITSYFSSTINNTENEQLTTYLKILNTLSISNIISGLEQNKINFNKNNEDVINTILLFISVKFLTMSNDAGSRSTNEEIIMNKINDQFFNFSHPIYWCYKNKILGMTIIPKYSNLFQFKEKYSNLFLVGDLLDSVFSSITDSLNLIIYFLNQISFIHLNEFLVFSIKNEANDKSSIALLQMNLLIYYFTWRNLLKVYT